MQQADHPSRAAAERDDADPLTRLWLVCRRQVRLATSVFALSLFAWATYLATATPYYQSSASIHVLAEEPDYWRKSTAADPASELGEKLASQMELIKSGETLRRLIVDGGLLRQADFAEDLALRRPHAAVQWLRAALGRDTGADPVTDALALLETRLTVKRLGDSSVLSLTYSARSPAAAATMTEQVVKAYFDARRRTQAESAGRAADWLSGKVEELHRLSLAEDDAVEAFRRRHGLLASNGRLMGDQRLTSMMEQLVLAQAELGQADARSRKLESILTVGDMDAAVAQSLASPLVNELRQHYLEASRRGADLDAKYGADHQQTRRLKGEAEEYRRQMFEELSRIAAAYHSEAEMTRARVEALTEDIGQAGAEKADLDAVQVTLRDLESRADNARRLYLDHLARLNTARQEVSLPEIAAAVISAPTLPTAPSSPRKALSLFIATSLGLALALAAAILRDFSDRLLRRPDRLQRLIGAPVFGLIPMIDRAPSFHPDFSTFPICRPDAIRMADVLDRHAIDNPRSRMTDAIRRTLSHITRVDSEKTALVMGVVSCGAGEGKTTIAANLASLSAMRGARTLLVDADRINPEASRRLAGHVLGEGMIRGADRASFLPMLHHPSAPLALLACPEPPRATGGPSLECDPAPEIEKAKDDFELIVIDLPPLAAGHAAEEAAESVDGILLVVEWGRVTEAALAEALRGAPMIAAKITGALFNRVQYDRLALYIYGGAQHAAPVGQGSYFSC
jgi:succinoglycan biosynthesis transport protein ExoP